MKKQMLSRLNFLITKNTNDHSQEPTCMSMPWSEAALVQLAKLTNPYLGSVAELSAPMHAYLRMLVVAEVAAAAEIWVFMVVVGVFGLVVPPLGKKLRPAIGYTIGLSSLPKPLFLQMSCPV
ncbi:hypothetical protein Ancab_017839 [Ancistrocladus abbreviatus]